MKRGERRSTLPTFLHFGMSGHGVQNIDFHGLHALLHGETLVHIHIGEAAFLSAYDAVALALKQQLHSQVAHLCGVDTVTAGGNAAALDMAQNGDTGIQINGVFDVDDNALVDIKDILGD